MSSFVSPISKLVANIQQSLNDFVIKAESSNSAPGAGLYPKDNPEIKAVLSEIRRENWMKLSFPYTFSVVNLVDANNLQGFGSFSLPIAPQGIRQSEPTSIVVTPTQGGTTTNHSGMRYKNLTIKGTTGISPFRGAGGVNRLTGEAILQPNDLKFRSGYEVFLSLRNWFRAYYEYKQAHGIAAQDLRLVFKNYKDGEFLIVELIKFDMDRSADKPFMYDYDLEFKVIAHLKFEAVIFDDEELNNILEKAAQSIDTARGIFLRSQDTLRQIESTYNNTILDPLRRSGLALKSLRTIVPTAADIGSRIRKNTLSAANTLAILLEIQALKNESLTSDAIQTSIAEVELPSDLAAAVSLQGPAILDQYDYLLMDMPPSIYPEKTLAEFETELEMSIQQPKSYYENLLQSLIVAKQNAEDFFNLGSTFYNNLFDITSTTSVNPLKEFTDAEYDVLAGFNSAITGLQLLLSTNELFQSTYDDKIAEINALFNNNIELQTSQAAKEYIVPSGVSLERIAQDQLNDSTRWGEIAELNGLIWPYIIDDRSSTLENVAKPGDKILLPAPIVYGFSELPNGKIAKTAEGMTELERSLGTDLKLSSNFDLALSALGDFELVSGAENLAQGVFLKMSYEPGDLMRYPEIGASLQIGSKVPPLFDLKDDLVNTLMQDSRIQSVINIVLKQENSAIYLSFDVRVKQVDIPIPVKLQLIEAA